MFSFTVPGRPVAKSRPKIPRYGKAYYPKSTVEYLRLISMSFLEKYPFNYPIDADKPVRVELKIYKDIPKAYSKKVKEQMNDGTIRPTKRTGDIDNICKSILDAMNDRAYVDDSQVVSLEANMYYSYEPRVEVVIKETK